MCAGGARGGGGEGKHQSVAPAAPPAAAHHCGASVVESRQFYFCFLSNRSVSLGRSLRGAIVQSPAGVNAFIIRVGLVSATRRRSGRGGRHSRQWWVVIDGPAARVQ